MSEPSNHERGVKEGATDALIRQHSARLDMFNGKFDRLLTSNDDLSKCIRELASEIRTLQEGGRIAEERVKVAADVLATETERRREELAVTAVATESSARATDRSFSKRERLAGLTVTIAIAVVTFYLTTK